MKRKKKNEDEEVDNLENYYTPNNLSSVYDPEIDDIEGTGSGKYDSRNYNTDSYNEDLFEKDEDNESDEESQSDKSDKSDEMDESKEDEETDNKN